MTKKTPRILLAKPGLDGHDRGVKTVVHALRDAGFEVIYTGLHRTPMQIVEMAIDNDVDIIGLSVLSGAHIPICEETTAAMKAAGISDKPLMVGGVIPERDIPTLEALGVEGIFPSNSPFDDIVTFIRNKTNAS
jgi:methylmalonyl-CoA mutase C-terminal domain/subunit